MPNAPNGRYFCEVERSGERAAGAAVRPKKRCRVLSAPGLFMKAPGARVGGGGLAVVDISVSS